MQQVIYGLFEDYFDADEAVTDLLRQGYKRADITVITQSSSLPTEPVAHESIDDGATEGAGIGASIGGLTGLIAGIGAMAVPGFGPLLAVGPLLTVLSGVAAGAGLGAVTGGLVGALVDWGIPDNVARTYGKSVKDGSVLLAINSHGDNVEAIETMLADHTAHDINMYELADRHERAQAR